MNSVVDPKWVGSVGPFRHSGPSAKEALIESSVFCVSRSPVFVSIYRRSPDMPQRASDQMGDVEVVRFDVRQARNRELETGAWILVGARGSRVKRKR